MHSNTLTFPTAFPGFAPRSDHRSFRDLLNDSKALWPRQPSASDRVEKRLRKSARRGRRIVLGTAELPYEPLVLKGAPLAALRDFGGLEIAITTNSPGILERLELLIELDRRHAVRVDVLIATLDPDSRDLQQRLRAASALGAEGIATRLILPDPVNALPAGAAALQRLFEAAIEGHIYDLPVAGAWQPGWRRLVQRLRLENGFPRALPSRG